MNKPKLTAWFNKYSTGFIGVIEYKSDRMLIQDTDTISAIQAQVTQFTNR